MRFKDVAEVGARAAEPAEIVRSWCSWCAFAARGWPATLGAWWRVGRGAPWWRVGEACALAT